MPSVSTLKMAACLRSQEEHDVVCWAEVAWRDTESRETVQWVGYVRGNACVGITWDEGRGFLVYINQQYMGHAVTAREAMEEVATLLADTSEVMAEFFSWLKRMCVAESIKEVHTRTASREYQHLRVAFIKQ